MEGDFSGRTAVQAACRDKEKLFISRQPRDDVVGELGREGVNELITQDKALSLT